MNECEKYLSDILDAAAGRTEPSQALRSHLEKCSDCRELLTEAEGVHRATSSLPADEVSPVVTERILAAAREHIKPSRKAVRWPVWRYAVGLVAVSPALFLIGLWLLRAEREPLDPAAVAALEEDIDRGLGRARSQLETLWPHRGWDFQNSRSVTSRMNDFQHRLERFRSRTQQGTFPLDFAPEKNDRRQEGHRSSTDFKGRYVS